MERLAIEINGAGLLVTDGSGVLAEEPGYAIVEDGKIITGSPAWAQARLKPASLRSGFWSGLRVDGDAADINGELAFEHLRYVWNSVGRQEASAVVVVPGGFDEQQLGLVLGIAQECGISVEALVDAGVAGSALQYHERELLYIDATLKTVTVSRIAQSADAAVEQFQTSDATGLAAFTDTMAKAIAQCFVLDTRFDPLHDAGTEQALYDGMPGWLEALHESGRAQAQLEHAGEMLLVELSVERVRSACLALIREIVRLIGVLSSPGKITVVQLNSRLARLPGLCNELARIQGVEIVALEHGWPAVSALQRVPARAPGGEDVRLLRRLPFSGEVQPAAVPEPARALILQPTHVVFKGIGYRIGEGRTEVVGDSEATSVNGSGSIAIEGLMSPAVQCAFEKSAGDVCVVAQPQVRVFVNDEPVDDKRELKPGDRIRIGSLGELLHIVFLES